MRRVIFLILLIVWMAVIFGFSASDGETSSDNSFAAGRVIRSYFAVGFDYWPEDRQAAFAEACDIVIRKTAHVMEYAVLGFFAAGAVTGTVSLKTGILSWGISSAYAVSDEIHQLFVPGRSGQAVDVLIDATGCALGVLLMMHLLKRAAERRSRRETAGRA